MRSRWRIANIQNLSEDESVTFFYLKYGEVQAQKRQALRPLSCDYSQNVLRSVLEWFSSVNWYRLQKRMSKADWDAIRSEEKQLRGRERVERLCVIFHGLPILIVLMVHGENLFETDCSRHDEVVITIRTVKKASCLLRRKLALLVMTSKRLAEAILGAHRQALFRKYSSYSAVVKSSVPDKPETRSWVHQSILRRRPSTEDSIRTTVEVSEWTYSSLKVPSVNKELYFR